MFTYSIRLTMDSVNAVLQPDFHRGYCDYFFYLMVIYLIIGTLTVADFALSGVSNIKNFSGFMRNHMGSKVLQLLAIGVHFFVIRLLYSMCARSLPVKEGYRKIREGTTSNKNNDEGFYGGGPEDNQDI